ncbi:MAG: TetR/AcrR family transcriptional regulator [Porphyrobacter sp.]|nr:TetR/AcrR family transcriptional regulator [Porphyrobacter sp.]
MNRASPLPAAERRAAIMAATEQLLIAKGGTVSTREIAEAAGIAEGTIFRVFPTKDAIIDAIFADAFDQESARAELAGIDCGRDLDTCLIQLVTSLQRRIQRILALIGAVGFHQPAGADKEKFQEQRKLGYDAIAALLRPHAAKLRLEPEDAARHLHGLVLAMTHPMLTDRPIGDPAAIVDVALNGIARQPSQSETRGS